MQQIIRSRTSAIILALLISCVLGISSLLGIGGLLAVQQAATDAASRSAVSALEPTVTQTELPASLPTPVQVPGAEAQQTPTDAGKVPESVVTPIAFITPEARPPELGQPVVGEAAAVEVSRIEVNSEVGGVEITLHLRNRQPIDLTFPFEPSKAFSLSDASGRPYHLAWAEHDGQPRVPAGGEAQLARAFFAGPVDEIPAEGLRLNARGIPGLEDAQFDLRLPQLPPEPLAAGELARGRGLVVTLDSTKVEPEQGAVDVVLSVANSGREDLSFAFSPQRDLSLSDADGNGYNLEWAEYNGRVSLTPGQQTRLVRGHFRGPVDRLNGKELRVQVRHLPQIGGATWSVPTELSTPAPSRPVAPAELGR